MLVMCARGVSALPGALLTMRPVKPVTNFSPLAHASARSNLVAYHVVSGNMLEMRQRGQCRR